MFSATQRSPWRSNGIGSVCGTTTFSVGNPLPTQATTATTATAGTTVVSAASTTADITVATTPEAGKTTNSVGMVAIPLLAVTGMVAMFAGNKEGQFQDHLFLKLTPHEFRWESRYVYMNTVFI